MNPYECLGFSGISVIYWENIRDARGHTTENSWKRESKPAWLKGSTLHCNWFCPFTTTKRQKTRCIGAKPKCYILVLCCQEHLSLYCTAIRSALLLFMTFMPLYTLALSILEKNSCCTFQGSLLQSSYDLTLNTVDSVFLQKTLTTSKTPDLSLDFSGLYTLERNLPTSLHGWNWLSLIRFLSPQDLTLRVFVAPCPFYPLEPLDYSVCTTGKGFAALTGKNMCIKIFPSVNM